MKFLDLSRKHRLWKIVLSGAVAAAAVFFIWMRVGGDEARSMLNTLDIRFVALAATLYGTTLFLRAVRFYFFFRGAISIRDLLRIAAIHSFWNNFLPFRAGEFSYLYLIKKHPHVTDGENVVSLVIARIFDAAIVLAALFSSSFFLFSRQQGTLQVRFGAMAFLALFIICGTAVFVIFRKRLCTCVARLADSLEGWRPTVFSFLFSKVREATAALGSLRSRSRLKIFFFLSCLVWLSDFLSIWSAFAAGGVYLGFSQAVFMAAFPVFATLIPFQAPLGLGTFEATISSGLLIVGVSVASAIWSSVYLHAEFLLFSVIAFLAAQRIRRRGVSMVSY